MISKITFYVCIISAFMLISCDELSQENDFQDYPKFIPELSISELEQLNEKYHSENEDDLCSTLNEYGFTGFSRVLFLDGVNPCTYRKNVLQEIFYSDDLLEKAKNIIVKNQNYTNVKDPSLLVLKDTIALYGCTICEGPDINSVPLEWKFIFDPQVLNGVKVSNSEIVVHVDVNGVNRIWGNWLPVIDPGFVNYGSNYAKEIVIGEKFSVVDESGEVIWNEITKEDIYGEPELLFTMVKVDGGAEIHKAWRVLVLGNNTKEIARVYYINTVDGEILEIESM